jgi:hypothetical protein
VGRKRDNDVLARQRAESLKTYMMWKHPYLDRSRIYVISRGIDWEGFRYLVSINRQIPELERELILKLIDIPDEDFVLSNLTKVSPQTYAYLKQEIFPLLQYATPRLVLNDRTTIQTSNESALKILVEKKIITVYDTVKVVDRTHVSTRDTVRVVDKVRQVVYDTVRVESSTPSDPDRLELERLIDRYTEKSRYIALKTNALYDVALLPNAAVEFAFGRDRRWSMEVEGMAAWWSQNSSPYYCYRIGAGSVELRKWLGDPSLAPLSGYYAGVYLMAGTYDLRWRKNEPVRGVQSDLSYSAGVTFGYSLRLARRLNLELGLGVGYLGGQYKRYTHSSDYDLFPYQSTHQRAYFGPTKAKVSLVWMVGGGMKTSKNIQ